MDLNRGHFKFPVTWVPPVSENQVGAFVDHNNNHRSHESFGKLIGYTAKVCFRGAISTGQKRTFSEIPPRVR